MAQIVGKKGLGDTRLAVTLLDGGTGEELMRRGLPDDRKTWSARAVTHKDHHDLLVDVHKSFLEAGSQIITINNYGITQGVGFSESEVLEFTQTAAQLARRAVQEHGSGKVCGSLPPLVESYRPDLVQEHAKGVEMYTKIAKAMHEYVDFYLAETLSSIEEMLQAVDAVASLEGDYVRPLFCSWTVSRGAKLRSGEPVSEAISQLLQQADATHAPLEAVLFNCAEPEAVTEALEAAAELKDKLKVADVRLGAYANRLTPISSDWTMAGSTEPQALRDDVPPQVYCDKFARVWVQNFGATLIGGCCGITPEHISVLKQTFGAESPGTTAK